MDFNFFVDSLKVFHVLTSKDEKYDYLFKIYDEDEVIIFLMSYCLIFLFFMKDESLKIEDIKNVMKAMYIDSIKEKKNDDKIDKGVFMTNEHFVESLARDIMQEFDKDQSGALDPDEFR